MNKGGAYSFLVVSLALGFFVFSNTKKSQAEEKKIKKPKAGIRDIRLV